MPTAAFMAIIIAKRNTNHVPKPNICYKPTRRPNLLKAIARS